ncbi:DUF421 domain-containing protein [Lysinibacillus pakistanensis]|uniref:DUF421 domain-containing protein n=1 Tax=Lysinibacillus pakistanensis TaxID=759811 RepID=A0AAX3WSV7_9BACI|nr:DUF421 domain-containing protein [Lysinibacillus pakistanensis]MDM5234633.1 DUF421 domain-containing protein [Lysinibacillus pakistanensis]QGG52517.1 DUF421 domain-containing protein [Lysinibacillus pakistanensis]WHY45208.1 DUF421 domain-containing protein [Lysinibacillus pakistanensis]WHY50217.1 DUF421 domain-containing protein [Lysinibacillus pakistanensis]
MEEYLIIIFRTCFIYVFILIIFRLMGKREVGELSVIDLVVSILIAEVAAFALDDVETPLINAILPIIMLFFIQIGSAYFSLKNKKFRDLVDGDPVLLIKDGVILEKEMRKQRYNLDDLCQQLRENGTASVTEVAYAYLEPSGNLSVYEKDEKAFVYPLIIDGDIQERHLKLLHKDAEWLMSELTKNNITDSKTVFFCIWEENRLHIQLKES